MSHTLLRPTDYGSLVRDSVLAYLPSRGEQLRLRGPSTGERAGRSSSLTTAGYSGRRFEPSASGLTAGAFPQLISRSMEMGVSNLLTWSGLDLGRARRCRLMRRRPLHLDDRNKQLEAGRYDAKPDVLRVGTASPRAVRPFLPTEEFDPLLYQAGDGQTGCLRPRTHSLRTGRKLAQRPHEVGAAHRGLRNAPGLKPRSHRVPAGELARSPRRTTGAGTAWYKDYRPRARATSCRDP